MVAALVVVTAQGCPGASRRPVAPSRPADGVDVVCDRPVAAPVSDGFRPPDRPWLPGNRGLTFATVPGMAVYAVSPGWVSYAGRIAGAWYVTVERDGAAADITYSYLASTSLHAGERVATGDRIGLAGTIAFQLGYRDRSGYLDPGGLVAEACAPQHAVLVPVPE